MFDEKLVVHFLQGGTIQGFGENFLPGEGEILLQDLQGKIHHIELRTVKVICFVKDFRTVRAEGDRKDTQFLYQAMSGRKLNLVFKDGEHLEGTASLRERPTQGFFLTPLSDQTNNLQIYVNPEALLHFGFSD
ncbi:MAG: hypothetical protein WBS54_14220 [Acidobacteriota bacterium]